MKWRWLRWRWRASQSHGAAAKRMDRCDFQRHEIANQLDLVRTPSPSFANLKIKLILRSQKDKKFDEYHFTKWLLSDERFQKEMNDKLASSSQHHHYTCRKRNIVILNKISSSSLSSKTFGPCKRCFSLWKSPFSIASPPSKIRKSAARKNSLCRYNPIAATPDSQCR